MRIFLRLLVVISLVIFLSELIVRTTLTHPVSSVSDAELGWTYKPYSTIYHTSEGRAINKMNSMGFNDADPKIQDHVIQILVLGDSVTQALQVPRTENFTTLAEVMAPCLDVFNAGRAGLSPLHYPIVLSRVTKSIKPDLNIIVISSGDLSDMKNSNYEIIRDDTNEIIIGLRLKEKPLSKLRVKLDPILSRSALATYLMQRIKALIGSNKAQARNHSVAAFVSNKDEKHIHEILVYLLASMNSKVPTAILYIPKFEYGANRKAFTHIDSNEFERLLKNAARGVGVPFLTTDTYMISSYSLHGQPGVGFHNKNILGGHLNKLGHQATAQALLDLVTSTGIQCPTN